MQIESTGTVRADETLPVLRQAQARQGVPRHGDVAGLTDRGKVRASNEDQFLIADLDRWLCVRSSSFALSNADDGGWIGGNQGVLIVVADGMGGHGHGALASSVTVDAVLQHMLFEMPWFAHTQDHQRQVFTELGRAAAHCKERLEHVASRKGSDHEGMGTTLTIAYVEWPDLLVTHVGDSRCYLHRDGALSQVTTDHTVANAYGAELQGQMAARLQHVLVKAIGAGHEMPKPEFFQARLKENDVLLLCSDGLTNHLADQEIAAHLNTGQNADTCTRELVNAANERGGSDNITVVVARF